MNHRVRIIVEAGLTIALAAVLSMYKLTLPWNVAGGSISLAMVPLFIFASRRGVALGVAAGLLFGVIDYFIEPYAVHPVQVVVDYGVAFAACGLAGLLRPVLDATENASTQAALAIAAGLTGGAARFLAHFFSGVIFFAANAPKGQPVWLYSVLYNGSYLLPAVVACAMVSGMVYPALRRAVPPNPVAVS